MNTFRLKTSYKFPPDCKFRYTSCSLESDFVTQVVKGHDKFHILPKSLKEFQNNLSGEAVITINELYPQLKKMLAINALTWDGLTDLAAFITKMEMKNKVQNTFDHHFSKAYDSVAYWELDLPRYVDKYKQGLGNACVEAHLNRLMDTTYDGRTHLLDYLVNECKFSLPSLLSFVYQMGSIQVTSVGLL